MESINDIFGYDSSGVGTLVEKQFNLMWQNKIESVFSLGNGYLGLRSAFDETYPGQVRGLYVAGTFQTAGGSEISELPNFPDATALNVILDGEPIDLRHDEFTDYSRQLNLANGELLRKFTIRREDRSYELSFRRFVSFSQKHLIVTQLQVIPSHNGQLVFQETIDGTQTNHGAQHFLEGDKRATNDGIAYQTAARDGNLEVTLYRSTTFNSKPSHVRTLFPRRQVNREWTLCLAAGQPLSITSCVVVLTSQDSDQLYVDRTSLLKRAEDISQDAQTQGYKKELEKSAYVWNQQVWAGVPVRITSNNSFDQFVLNFGRYHTHIMTPQDSSRVNIAAKGLSGEGYRGHSFWDTDIFMLPYFQYEYPNIARNLLKYRVLQLPSCRTNAAINHYQGAQYPWESALICEGETTPIWGDLDVDTGKPMRIWTGKIEAHITADVAYALLAYSNSLSVGDKFYINDAFPVLIDTARYWASRVTWRTEHRRYEILDVIGPNEYKEHVDNNAYTNYMAYFNMTAALSAISELRTNTEQYDQLNQKFLLQDLEKQLASIVSAFYLPVPNRDHILPENDTFLGLKSLDLSAYREKSVGSISESFSMSSINEYQLCKQADVVLVMQMFADKFDSETRKRNLDYYEARTLHDSSLSFGSHAVLCARNEEVEKAYQYFGKAGLIDLNSDPVGSAEGIHAAAMVQLWNAVVQGFAGISQLGRILQIDPHLPEQWAQVQFPIHWQGALLNITISHDSVQITGNVEGPVQLQVGQHSVEFSGDCTVSLD